MNTFQDLINHGIEPHTAQKMLDNYSSKIGTMNGVYEITDITYDFSERGRDVTLKCSLCGREINRMMIKDKNKWKELIKSCPCQKEEKARIKKAELEKTEKIKKDKIQVDGVSMIGSLYGDYQIINFEFQNNIPTFVLKCTTCGNIDTVHYQGVKENVKKYKKCHKHGNHIKFGESYIGMKKNFLTVRGITRLPNGHRAFLCECDCGKIKAVETTHWDRGIVKSCGCKHDELLSRANKKDIPLNNMRIYHVYTGMKSRCYSPNSENYKYYGKRGITICDEWLNDFWKFREWAYANGYDENADFGQCTIERKDVNGNYCPENCCWITNAEQQKNKRTNIFFTMNGETKILADWQREMGISYSEIKRIINGNFERKRKKSDFSERVGFRLSSDEMDELEKYVKSIGMTISEYIRELIARDMRDKSKM